MAETEKSATKGPIPPYVSFTSLTNFIRGLGKKGLPNQIDKSVMTNLSGGMQVQVTSALKFLMLVDGQNTPTDWMRSVATGDEDEQKKSWKEIIEQRYKFLFEKVNISKATTGQVSAEFTAKGATGDTTAKCISFFLTASKFAGIDVSVHVKPTRTKGSSTRQKKKPSTADDVSDQEVNRGSRPSETSQLDKTDVFKMLMEKFPAFDPAWAPELKASWFSAYEELMRRSK